MKSEKSFWTLAAITYTIAWGWSFFFANAYFWDDWASFFGKSPQEPFDLGYYDEKHFLNPIINSVLLNFGLWAFRVVIFVLMFGAGVLAYKIVSRLGLFSLAQSRFFTLVFLLVPVNHARFSIQTFEYSFAYFFFFFGWYLLTLRKPIWRIAALVAFLVAIGTPSLLTFMILPLINLFYLDKPRGKSQIFTWLLRNSDIFAVVVIFVWFFRTSQGDVEKYGASSYGLLYSISLGLAFGIFAFVMLRRRRRESLPMRNHIFIYSAVALVWLGTVPYWIVGYDPARGLPDVFQLHAGARIQAGEFFTLSMSVLKLVGGIVFFLVVLFAIKKKSRHSGLIIPNIFVVLYLLNNYFVGPLDWDSRLQLLWPLGLALVMVGLFESIPSHLYQKNSVAVIISLTLLTSLISAEYYVDSLKQKALIVGIKTAVKGENNEVYFVREEQNLLNARSRTYRGDEWNGIFKSALDEDYFESEILSVLDHEQSCPDSKVCLVINPRVTSSFIGSLINRRVDIKIGCSDLSIVPNSFDINACPER